ncbi:LysR family transcriptional regulator [Falsiroseomonas sp. E2-1-a20]|uniref:LysR family transcriptional regulator n=1 Tax=Falsiroseomonas sp. E2-1-a20 TaxID=3239300 RepID=UPI003F339BDD
MVHPKYGTKLPDYEALALFLRVAAHDGFGAAARASRMPKSTLSRRIAEFEADLGTPLLRRTSRGVSLTAEGAALAEACRGGFEGLDAAIAHAAPRDGALRGPLVVSAPQAFGVAVVEPALLDLAARHPALRLDLRLEDRRADFEIDGLDLAIRMGELDDSALAGRRLCLVARAVVASPALLAGRTPPTQPADLAAFAALAPRQGPLRWMLQGPGGALATIEPAAVACINDAGGLRRAALAGLGLALLPRFLVKVELRAGTLVEPLPSWQPAALPATALFRRAATAVPAVRDAVDAIARLAASGNF